MNNKNVIIKQLMNIFDKNKIKCKFDDYLYVDNILPYSEFKGFEQSFKYILFKEDFKRLDYFESELSFIKRIDNSYRMFLFLPDIVANDPVKINRLKEFLGGISYLIIVYTEVVTPNE